MLKKSQSVPIEGKRDNWKRWCYGLIQQKTMFFVVMYNGCLAGNVLSPRNGN